MCICFYLHVCSHVCDFLQSWCITCVFKHCFSIILGHPEGARAGQAKNSQVGCFTEFLSRLLGSSVSRGPHLLSTGVAGCVSSSRCLPGRLSGHLRMEEAGGGLLPSTSTPHQRCGARVLWGASLRGCGLEGHPGIRSGRGLIAGCGGPPAGASAYPGAPQCGSPSRRSAFRAGVAAHGWASSEPWPSAVLWVPCLVLTPRVLLLLTFSRCPQPHGASLACEPQSCRLFHTLGSVPRALPAFVTILLLQ